MISFIVPIYNVEPYLEECLTSITDCEELMSICEVILVDDKSPDNCKEIYSKFLDKYNNFHLIINKQNYGLSISRNNGFDEASKKYIFFLDADDFIYPKTILHMLDVAETYGSEVVTCLTNRKVGDEFEKDFINIPFLEGITKDITNITLEEYPFILWKNISGGKLINRQYLIDNNIFHPNERVLYEDIYFGLLILLKSKNLSIVSDVGYCWRLNPTSITNSEQNEENGVDRLKMINKILPYVNETSDNLLNCLYYRFLTIDLMVILININNYSQNFITYYFENVQKILEDCPQIVLKAQPIFNAKIFESIQNENYDKFYKLVKEL